ncbi:MAG: hypothetical protein O3B09_01530, partial [Proteobacteria bacterium]|nr:hypothetical protein [Pseudomonadota bacterium]
MKIFEIRILLVLAIFFLLSSCSFTQDVVWGIRIDNGEVIKDLMINEEGTKLVLHGKKYHYFLNDDSKKIQKLFLWEARDKLIVNTTSIRTWGTRVRVVIYFEGYTKNLSEKQTEFLKKLGGRLTSKGKKIWIPGGFELMGNRYASESKS